MEGKKRKKFPWLAVVLLVLVLGSARRRGCSLPATHWWTAGSSRWIP